MDELGLKSKIDTKLAQKLLPVLYRFVTFCNGGCWTSHHDGKLRSRTKPAHPRRRAGYFPAAAHGLPCTLVRAVRRAFWQMSPLRVAPQPRRAILASRRLASSSTHQAGRLPERTARRGRGATRAGNTSETRLFTLFLAHIAVLRDSAFETMFD